MDHSLGAYLEATGITDVNSADYETSIYDSYHELYKGYGDLYQEFIDQEYVAHMVELYEHGVFTPQEIAPVQHILDAMFRGDFSRGTPDEARLLNIPEPDYQVPVPIANRLRKITDAIEPARSDPGQPGAAQAGLGAPQRVSPADRITPGREDFARSSLIGEALGRRPIDEPLRQEAVRTYLGKWWGQDAALKRAKLQGFTVPAWHATRSDFLVPNPNVPSRDFGFHVAINTPNAANERAGFSQEEIAEQRKWQAVVPEAISNMVGFWRDRRAARNLPLLVKAHNPLRVADLNAWGSIPMWRGFITDLFAGRIHDIDYLKTHKVFKEIYAMTESVMQEKALGDPNFDDEQTFRQLLINILENHGYDSIIYKNDYEDVGNDSLFLWDSARVRSAFDAFDPRANGNPGLYASVPFMEADLRQELNRALKEEGLETVMPLFSLRTSGNDIVNTPEFKRWFGDSKVVDENGEPLVVYHGTKADIESFQSGVDGGIHFGTSDQANMRAPSGNITPVYLRAEKLKRTKDSEGNWKKTIARAKSEGNDGIVYLNRYEGIPREEFQAAFDKGITQEQMDSMPDSRFRKMFPSARDSYIVFEPTQIKSIFNRGTFDPTDPRIAFSLGGLVEDSPETNQRPMTELYTDYLKITQKSGKKPVSFKEFAQR